MGLDQSVVRASVGAVTSAPVQSLSSGTSLSSPVTSAGLVGTQSISSDDLNAAVDRLRQQAITTYGGSDLGEVRFSSQALEDNPTGIRFGELPRVVLPFDMAKDRGGGWS